MYRDLGQARLRNGELVSAGVVSGPDLEWAERLLPMLGHKGNPWNWQIEKTLRQDLGIEALYYVLHRDGRPFANIMTAERLGVGIFGHVWTDPADRQQGASTEILKRLLADFRLREGRALYLGTEYDSPPYHYYRKFGFVGIEPGSGYMDLYGPEGRDSFLSSYFRGDTNVLPLDWRHWPSASALFLGDFPGVVRIAALKLIGRTSSEGPMAGFLWEASLNSDSPKSRAVVLEVGGSGAVAGMACLTAHPHWPETALADAYLHPEHWGKADALLEALQLAACGRCIAYCERGFEAKHRLLERHGFAVRANLPQWVRPAPGQAPSSDVLLFERTPQNS